jgi:hypothetical protein
MGARSTGELINISVCARTVIYLHQARALHFLLYSSTQPRCRASHYSPLYLSLPAFQFSTEEEERWCNEEAGDPEAVPRAAAAGSRRVLRRRAVRRVPAEPCGEDGWPRCGRVPPVPGRRRGGHRWRSPLRRVRMPPQLPPPCGAALLLLLLLPRRRRRCPRRRRQEVGLLAGLHGVLHHHDQLEKCKPPSAGAMPAMHMCNSIGLCLSFVRFTSPSSYD